MPNTKIKIGRIKRISDMPLLFIATSSNDSARLPKVINDDNNIAIGNANKTPVCKATMPTNLSSVQASIPLPTISSIYFQKNCTTTTNKAIKNVAINGPINVRNINLSSFAIKAVCFA